MKVVFAGPSLSGEIADCAVRYPALQFRPPAACGDILGAVDAGATTIGLIDGYFGERPSVWHKEILFALDRGVVVAGGASMGALRAAECAAFGMVGIGDIYRDYAEGRLVDDEAVAVSHAPEALRYLPLSVPWVDFVATVTALHRDKLISVEESRMLLLSGRFLHFSERTFARAIRDCAFAEPDRGLEIGRLLAARKVQRKRANALEVLAWMAVAPEVAIDRGWVFSRTSHWDRLLQSRRPKQPDNACVTPLVGERQAAAETVVTTGC